AGDRDLACVHTLAHHLVLHGLAAALGKSLVVAIRTHRIGVTGHHHLHEAVLLRGFHRFGNDRLGFRRQVRLVEVEEDDERLHRRRWRRWWRWRRWGRRWRCRRLTEGEAQT